MTSPINNNNNTNNSEQEPVCVGTIIEDNNNNNSNNHHHQHNNDAYAWGSKQHHQHQHHQHQNHFSQTLPSFQQPQQQQQHQQQQNVVYARNPQTGETVMFPVIPAMFAPPNHHSGSPTYEYHGTTRATLNNTHANQTNNNNNNNNDHQQQQQQQIIIPEPNSKSWSTGLFECFDDSEGLIESWCCGRCQLSRQYGFMQNGTNDIDLFSFFFSVVVDVLAGPTGIVALTWWTRRAIRQRYGIIGNDCSDFFAAACCGPCATHQQYRQMSIENEWPTGCCINQVYSLPASKRHSNIHLHPHEMGQQQSRSHGGTTQLHQGEIVSDQHTNNDDTSMV